MFVLYSLCTCSATCLPVGVSQPRYPLVNLCHVMSLIAEDMTVGLREYLRNINCTLVGQSASQSPTDCTLIQCHDITVTAESVNFAFEVMPCSSPPEIRVSQSDSRGYRNKTTLSKSRTIGLDLGDGAVSLFFKIGQHLNQLSLGLEVSKH